MTAGKGRKSRPKSTKDNITGIPRSFAPRTLQPKAFVERDWDLQCFVTANALLVMSSNVLHRHCDNSSWTPTVREQDPAASNNCHHPTSNTNPSPSSCCLHVLVHVFEEAQVTRSRSWLNGCSVLVSNARGVFWQGKGFYHEV